jgi:hypothetical protein
MLACNERRLRQPPIHIAVDVKAAP